MENASKSLGLQQFCRMGVELSSRQKIPAEWFEPPQTFLRAHAAFQTVSQPRSFLDSELFRQAGTMQIGFNQEDSSLSAFRKHRCEIEGNCRLTLLRQRARNL